MISVVIPVRDVHDATEECIANLRQYADGDIDVIVVDNGSETPARFNGASVLRNEKNIGFWPSMLQGIQEAKYNYVLCMHNDVFIWESGFDNRIFKAFESNPQLAAVGLFGGRGVDVNGGRGHPEGNMLAKKYGTEQSLHGHWLREEHPAVVFDSLAICIDKEKLYTIDYKTIPPHHWTDRLLCLRFIKAGYHCLTVGIAFDHGGAFTSSKSMSNFAEEWCLEHNIPANVNWDTALYRYGEELFRHEMATVLPQGRLQLWVNKDFQYYVR